MRRRLGDQSGRRPLEEDRAKTVQESKLNVVKQMVARSGKR